MISTWCVADLQGRLRKATRLKGIENFRAAEMGLQPMHVQTWGAFVFIAHDSGGRTLDAWLGEGGVALLPRLPSAESHMHVGRREYVLQCNWKVGGSNMACCHSLEPTIFCPLQSLCGHQYCIRLYVWQCR